MDHKPTIKIRIICLNPPSVDSSIFGLQDKTPSLRAGQLRADGALQFECDVHVKQRSDTALDFSGTYVHGKLGERFLYLSYGAQQNDEWKWHRRIKIMLRDITVDQVEAVAEDGHLEAAVDGTRSATVPLLGDGWVVR